MTNRERMIRDINALHIGTRYKIDDKYYICKCDDISESYYLESDDLVQSKYQNYVCHHMYIYPLREMLLYWGKNGYYKSIELIK